MSTVEIVYVKHTPDVICPRCENIMTSIQACHEKCFKCGAELDCSDQQS